MFLRHNWLIFCVMPGLTGHQDPRSESGMTMEFGFGSPIGVGTSIGEGFVVQC